MKDEFSKKLGVHEAVHTFLHEPPIPTTPVEEFESDAEEWGAFSTVQGQSLHGVTEKQNLAETKLEDAAFALAQALRIYYRRTQQVQQAEVWNMTHNDWHVMVEALLLNKAQALHAALPLTEGTPAPGTPCGITTQVVGDFNDLVEDYGLVIGAPVSARGQRKAKTTALRPRFRVIDGLLDDIASLIIGLRGKGSAQDEFVDSFFNVRRIGGHTDHAATPDQTPAP